MKPPAPNHAGLPPGPQPGVYFSTSEAHVCVLSSRPVFPRVTRLCVCVTGGRFKKEIVVDGQSYLLLIRDEGGPPEAQVSTTGIQEGLPPTPQDRWFQTPSRCPPKKVGGAL